MARRRNPAPDQTPVTAQQRQAIDMVTMLMVGAYEMSLYEYRGSANPAEEAKRQANKTAEDMRAQLAGFGIAEREQDSVLRHATEEFGKARQKARSKPALTMYDALVLVQQEQLQRSH